MALTTGGDDEGDGGNNDSNDDGNVEWLDNFNDVGAMDGRPCPLSCFFIFISNSGDDDDRDAGALITGILASIQCLELVSRGDVPSMPANCLDIVVTTDGEDVVSLSIISAEGTVEDAVMGDLVSGRSGPIRNEPSGLSEDQDEVVVDEDNDDDNWLLGNPFVRRCH